MAEYIDRERLLHRFNIDDMMNVNGTLVSLNDARNIISGFPAADVAPVGWISVKDKLPEPEQDVLVIAHGWSDRLLYIGSYQRMEAETSWLTGVTSKASDWSLWGVELSKGARSHALDAAPRTTDERENGR